MENVNLNLTQINQTKINLAKTNLAYYSEKILGYDNSEHHLEWYWVVQNFLENENSSKMVLFAPRNHAKTTVFSINLLTWMLGNNPNLRVLLVSNTASQSVSFLRSVKMIIENDDNYKSVFGSLKPQYPEKWSEAEIIVARNTKEKDASINAVGAGGAILSKRADIIICDDLLNKENTRTITQRQKVEDWFNDVLMPVLEPKTGKLIMVGTVFHMKDLISKKMMDPTYDVKMKYQAILQEAKNQKLWDEYRSIMLSNHETGKKDANKFYQLNKEKLEDGAKVLWPERWSYKRLFDEKISVGTRSFNLMYQNDPRNEEDTLFKEAWIDQCSNEGMRLIPAYDDATDVYDIVARTQGVDLGVKEEIGADETVIFTLGKTRKNKLIMMNVAYGNWSPASTRQNIAQSGKDIKPHLILVESNAYQASLQMDMKELTDLPIKGFQTTAEKYDEALGINGLAVGLENNQWILPSDPSDMRTKAVFEKLKEAMLDYVPGEHTPDILIAMWLAWVAMRNIDLKAEPKAVRSSGQYQSIQAGI